MRQFEYSAPHTLEETFALLGQGDDGTVRPFAGGTDLLTLMKADIVAPEHLVDLKRLPDLPRGISATEGGGLRLGALTTLTEIEVDPLVQQHAPLLAEAASLAATPQLRNLATLGGNLLQRPRCWYFRNPLFHCWLKGGDICHARDGENQLHALFGDSPCVAVHPSDLAPALVALGAEVHLRGPQGERTLPLAEFFALPEPERRTETTISPDELILSLHIPAAAAGTRSTYVKAMDRKVWSFALVSVAATLRLGGPDNRRIEGCRLVLGGVAPVPWPLPAAEQALIGHEATPSRIQHATTLALSEAEPLAHNGYKLPLARGLIQQALSTLADEG